MDFEGIKQLVISQKKEWGEILTGFEVGNKYSILNSDGSEIMRAFEQKSNWLMRQFLKGARPFTIVLTDTNNSPVLKVKRFFRFIFHEAEVFDKNDQLIGRIKKQFTFFRRVYKVTDPSGVELFELFGPVLHPWTFKIIEGGNEVGKITKKWSGMLKESFTKADNFGAEFPGEWDVKKKKVASGAVFLIDFVHFEFKN